jgi:hypothetical protein
VPQGRATRPTPGLYWRFHEILSVSVSLSPAEISLERALTARGMAMHSALLTGLGPVQAPPRAAAAASSWAWGGACADGGAGATGSCLSATSAALCSANHLDFAQAPTCGTPHTTTRHIHAAAK